MTVADEEGDGGQALGVVIVLVPDAADSAAQGVEEAHVTLVYLGDDIDPAVVEGVRRALAGIAEQYQPFQMSVSGAGFLGPDKARVLLLESEDLKGLRDAILRDETVLAAVAAAGDDDRYPFFIPHMTLGYDGELPPEYPETVSGAALGLWAKGAKQNWDLTGHTAAPELDVVVPVQSLSDLDLGIRVAAVNPAGRWYVAKRAAALGVQHRIPADWGSS